MNPIKNLAPVFLFSVFVLAFSPASGHAAVQISPDFQGMLVITFAEGEVILLEPGEPVPAIPSGSIIEVFDGRFTVSTQPGDKVTASCLQHDIFLVDEASITLTCGEVGELAQAGKETGSVTVVKSTVNIADPSGKVTKLLEGTTHLIQLETLAEAPATAAAELAGRPLEEVDPPVDSRNIESSPSQ